MPHNLQMFPRLGLIESQITSRGEIQRPAYINMLSPKLDVRGYAHHYTSQPDQWPFIRLLGSLQMFVAGAFQILKISVLLQI